MAPNWKLLVFALCLLTSLLFSQVSADGDLDTAVEGWLIPGVRSGCTGTVAECLENEDEEFDLDSESNRRVLATRGGYISYDALQKNIAPCLRRGASYYNCRAGAQANPYSRRCSAITRCRH